MLGYLSKFWASSGSKMTGSFFLGIFCLKTTYYVYYMHYITQFLACQVKSELYSKNLACLMLINEDYMKLYKDDTLCVLEGVLATL